MPRRVTLPGAAELFRGTETPPAGQDEASTGAGRRPSGRVRHDEKITVYVSTDELVALEAARLQLRTDHGLAVDRGRIVRAAIAMAMDELAGDGDSELVRRLRAE